MPPLQNVVATSVFLVAEITVNRGEKQTKNGRHWTNVEYFYKIFFATYIGLIVFSYFCNSY